MSWRPGAAGSSITAKVSKIVPDPTAELDDTAGVLQLNNTSRASERSEGDNVIELTLPATPTHLGTARTLAAELATRLDFNLDEVDDLRMAVDEACATLVNLSIPSSMLSCVFTISETHLVVETRVTAAGDKQPAQDTFGWQVLMTLVDEVDAVLERSGGHGGSGLHRVGIRLSKKRTGAVSDR